MFPQRKNESELDRLLGQSTVFSAGPAPQAAGGSSLDDLLAASTQFIKKEPEGIEWDPLASAKYGLGTPIRNIGGTGQMLTQMGTGEEAGWATGMVKAGTELQGARKPSKLEDIRSARDILAWTGSAILEQLPQYGLNVAGGAVGTVVGGAMGAGGGPAGIAAGGIAGGKAGAGVMAGLQNFGENYLSVKESMEDELKRQGITDPEAFKQVRDQAILVAAPSGAMNTLMDMVEPTRTVGKMAGLVWKPIVRAEGKYLRGAVKEVGKELVRGARGELGTETGQEATTIAAEQAGREIVAARGGKPSYTPGTAEVLSRMLNAGAAGAVTGGAFSGGAQIYQEYQNRPKPLPIDPEEAATELKPGWMAERRQEEVEATVAPSAPPPSTTPPPPPGTVPVPEERQLTIEFPEAPPPTDEDDLAGWEPETERMTPPPPQIDVPPSAAPQQFQRYEEPGASPPDFSKPHGIYTTPAEFESPHIDLGGKQYIYNRNPDANVLSIRGYDDPGILMRRGAKSAGAGVWALREIVGPAQFQSLRSMTLPQLQAYAAGAFPEVEWGRYYDQQEVMEGLGGMLARQQGYDAVELTDPDPRWNEYVGLTPKSMTEVTPPVTSTTSGQPTPVVQPEPHVVASTYLDDPEQKQQQQTHGQLLWDSLPDAPKVGHYPIIDESGFFTREQQVELTGYEPGAVVMSAKSGALLDYLNLSRTLLNKMVKLAGRITPGHPPIFNHALALQMSHEPWSGLSVGQNGNWMFSVSPLAQTGKGFAENTWDQIEQSVIYAVNNGDPDAIAANEMKLSNGFGRMKDAYLKAYNKLPLSQEGGLVDLENVYNQRRQFMSSLDPFFQGIKVSLSALESGTTSRYDTATKVQATVGIVKAAPRTDNSTRVLAPSHSTAVIESLKGHPLLNKIGQVWDVVVTELALALERGYPQYKGIKQRMERAAILLPWHREPQVHRGQWWATTETLSKFLVSVNPWGWMTQHGANPDPNPRNTAVGVIGTMQHELTHALVIGHGGEFHKVHEEVLDAIAQFTDVNFLVDLLESVYADPKRPSEFNPELYTLYSQITAGYPAGFLHEPQRLGPKGRATQPPRPVSGGPGPQPGVGGGPGTTAPTAAVGAGEGYLGEELGDEAGYGWGSTGDAFFHPTTSPYLEGTQPLGPVATADLDTYAQQAVADAEKVGLAPVAQQDIAHYNIFMQWGYTLVQIGKKNPDVSPLQNYIEHVRDFWNRKNVISQIAEVTLREWQKLGGRLGTSKHAKAASEFLLRVSEQSERIRRRLTQAEKAALASQMGIHPDAVKFAEKVWSTLREALDRLEQAQKDHVTRTYPNDPALVKGRIATITKEFNRLRRRDYFPFSRFGKFAIVVKATKNLMYQGRRHRKGQIIRLESWESKQEMTVGYNDLVRQFKGQPVEVYQRYLEDIDYLWSGFPPSLYKDLSSKLGLDPARAGEMKEIFLSRSPGSGFVKHLMRRRGVAGMSRDAMRAYADYMMHISNHIARLEKGWEMEQAIDGMEGFIAANPSVEAGQLKSHMARHYQYLMNPTGDMAWLRGWMYNWFFSWNIKQALVNMMQVPQYAYPYLAKRYDDWPAARELARAIKDMSHLFTKEEEWKKKLARISPEDDRLIQRGQEAGFLNEGYTTEVGAMAQGGISGKAVRLVRGYLGRPGRILGNALDTAHVDQMVRHAIDMGTTWFKVSEDLNRRVVFIAAARLARAKGADADAQFRAGRDAVETSMFEYARWNRPEMMRGNLAGLFVFKTYLQHSLVFTLNNEGGWRFLLMTVVIAGLKGIPGADHLLELLGLALTGVKWARGMKNPKVDLEKEARLFIHQLGANPNLFLDGISKYTFGLGALPWVPNLDFSASIQLGRFLPTKGFIQGATGGMDPKQAIATVMTDLIGAPGTVMTNMLEGVFDDSPTGHKMLRGITPTGIRNLMEAYWMLSDEGYKDNQGNKLINVDLHNPTQFFEMIGRALGAAPTRLREVQEGMSAERQLMSYYQSERQFLLSQYSAADTREERAEAVKEIIRFNRLAPPAFGIKTSQANQSAKAKAKSRGLIERGLPAQKDFLPLYKEYRKAWPTEQPALP